MKIGVLATQTNVSRDTVRLYEKMGILTNISRPYPYNNYKEYGEENVARILMVKKMQKLGFTLREGKELIDAVDNDSFGETERKEFMQKKLDEIDQKIAELIQMKISLEKMLTKECDSEDKARTEQIKSKKVERQSLVR